MRQIKKLKLFERTEEFENKDIKIPNESPSVRVRRLLKQDNGIKKSKLTNGEMKEKLSEMISNTPHHLAHSGAFISGNSSFASNGFNTPCIRGEKSESLPQERQMRLFEEIKMEIKEELRRHKERKNGAGGSNMKVQNKSIKGNLSEVK